MSPPTPSDDAAAEHAPTTRPENARQKTIADLFTPSPQNATLEGYIGPGLPSRDVSRSLATTANNGREGLVALTSFQSALELAEDFAVGALVGVGEESANDGKVPEPPRRMLNRHPHAFALTLERPID